VRGPLLPGNRYGGRRQVVVYLLPAEHTILQRIARQSHVSVSRLCRLALRKAYPAMENANAK
jgi:hypothetical protein